MKKSDLKDGMEVILRNGKLRMFFKDNLYIVDKLNHELEKTTSISQYSDKLTNWDKDWDIIKVYYEGELLWERPKEVDWTKVEFGTKVRAWDEDNTGECEYEAIGKFLAYDEEYSHYEDDDDQLFLVYYEDETGANAGWFQYCELIEEE